MVSCCAASCVLPASAVLLSLKVPVLQVLTCVVGMHLAWHMHPCCRCPCLCNVFDVRVVLLQTPCCKVWSAAQPSTGGLVAAAQFRPTHDTPPVLSHLPLHAGLHLGLSVSCAPKKRGLGFKGLGCRVGFKKAMHACSQLTAGCAVAGVVLCCVAGCFMPRFFLLLLELECCFRCSPPLRPWHVRLAALALHAD